MSDAKNMYRKLCAIETSVPIFSRDWWLDATAGKENWDVAVAEKDGNLVAALPYVYKRRYGLTILSQPGLTQTLGPWLRKADSKYSSSLGQQKDLMEELIAQLPQFSHYVQNWHYSQSNWLPFFWNGFKQTTRYTYVLPDLRDEQLLWNGLQSNIRGYIRKATDRFGLKVRDDLHIDDFLKINQLVFDRQGINRPYSETLVKRLDEACAKRNARKIILAEDDQGRRHAGIYLIWDENSAYCLMSGSHPQLRSSGAISLCRWEAIKFARSVTRRFDFEGSMLEPVERFCRSFGAVQMPYFTVSKTQSRLLKTYFFLKDLKKTG